MARYRLVELAGKTIKALLEQRMNEALGASTVTVQLVTPAVFETLSSTTEPVVSIFLYRISENPELRNRPWTNAPDGGRRQRPMALELSYLITAWGSRIDGPDNVDERAAAEEHMLLGLAMQALHTHAEVGASELVDDLADITWGPEDSLQIALESLPVEDHYRIWDAAELAYRLSLTYRVRVLSLDVHRAEPGSPVIDAEFRAGERA